MADNGCECVIEGDGVEACNNRDEDCDGLVDEHYSMVSRCGEGECRQNSEVVCVNQELIDLCEPSDPLSDFDLCGEQKDNNCDGETDEGVLSIFYVDSDGDGFGNPNINIEECEGSAGFVGNASDCDDSNEESFPGASEICDALDNDCNGEVDEGFDNRGVDLVFVLDISGSFDEEIESMIQGIAPLLDDPITSTFRFGLVAVGTAGNGEIRPPYQYARMVSNFVPADEFLDILEAARMIQSAGMEPTIDAMFWTMQLYPFSWRMDSQKVIITMTDEVAQTVTGKTCSEISIIAQDELFELFVFALQPHHNTFLACVHGENRRLFTPAVNSETVFLQIKQIFDDLCIGD